MNSIKENDDAAEVRQSSTEKWVRENLSSNAANLIAGLGCFSSTIIGVTGLTLAALGIIVAVAGVLVALIVGVPGLLTVPEIDEMAKPFRDKLKGQTNQANTTTNSLNVNYHYGNRPPNGNADPRAGNFTGNYLSNGNMSNTPGNAPGKIVIEKPANAVADDDINPDTIVYWSVKVSRAELRATPSDSGAIVESLPKGTSLYIKDRQSGNSKWYYVRVESGSDGWIDGNLIEPS